MNNMTWEGGESPLPRRVNIVGTAPSSRHAAPFPLFAKPPGEDGEIWCVGLDPMRITPHFHRWYELHSLPYLLDRHNNPDFQLDNIRHVHWLAEVANQGGAVWLIQPDQFIPKAKVIPREEIEKEFGSECLTSTIAWMMCHAALEGYKDIWLWGVDMALNEEYGYQRQAILYLKREFEKYRGIKVSVPPESDLFMAGQWTYPECVENPEYRKLTAHRRALVHQLGVHQQQTQQGQLRSAHFMGAIETLDWFKKMKFGV